MHAADDSDGAEPTFVSDNTETILVGLAFSDRNLGLRVRSMISQMAAVEVVDIDDADLILTDVANAHTGPHLILQDRGSMDATANAVDKHAGKDVLEAAICLVAHGYRITAPRVERSRYSISGFGDTAPEAGEPLTTREQQVLEKLAAGANKMIARDLHMSLATAKFHVGSLLAKLGARNRTGRCRHRPQTWNSTVVRGYSALRSLKEHGFCRRARLVTTSGSRQIWAILFTTNSTI